MMWTGLISEIYMSWRLGKGIREGLGLYELKQQKPWFDEKC